MDRRTFGRLALGGAAALVLAEPARAQLVPKFAEQLKNGEFNWFPERSDSGPILIIVSIPDQLVHVYRNGIRIAASTCSTGKPGHRTPTGVFTILQKDKHHRSSTYNGAPMPNMNRLTWSGIALHAGNLPGFPASHGCVRLPLAFSERLFEITKLGMTVVIADERAFPASVVHPGMVLGDYEKSEFGGVQTAIAAKEYAARLVPTPRAKPTAIVVSRADATARILEDGREVARGPATIRDPGKAIGERAFTLVEADPASGSLTWSATDVGDAAPSGSGAADALRRISVGFDLLEEGRRRMQIGMALVTTDESATDATTTPVGFVVLGTIEDA